MSNLQPNPYNNVPGQHQNANPGPYQYGPVPSSQPPGGLKQDANSNSSLPHGGYNTGALANHFHQSASSSPAFNHPGMMPPPPPTSLHRSPVHPPNPKPTVPNPNQIPMQNIPQSSASPQTVPTNTTSSPYPPGYQQRQINDNAPPLIPSSQYNQNVTGPLGPMSAPPGPLANQYPAPSTSFSPTPMANKPLISGPGLMNPPFNQRPFPATSMPPGSMTAQPNVPHNGPPVGPPRNSPLMPPTSGSLGPGPNLGPPTSGPPLGPPRVMNGPASNMPGPTGPPVSGPGMGPPGPMRGPPTGPPVSQGYINQTNGPLMGSQQVAQGFPPTSMAPPSSIQNQVMPQGPPMQSLPTMGQPPSMPPAPPIGMSGQPKSNMQNRYPQMQQPNYVNNQPPPGFGKQYPQQYNPQALTQQMGQLSVTKQGFDQLWGHHMVDLLQCKHILPEYPEDPPEIKLGHQFAEASNCSSEIFRCTINRIPESNSLLQKSRLPLGLLIHPFKDLSHLPVIQCSSIVRCRACRTYINPFVYFVDAKRWKCNLCYRVNELPEEFQYDPVSQSYGDPTRRPEIKSATIEFIAPAEYMLRPPQPAVYLFLFDVSQIARDSGYLQVVCDTLKSCLEQLPGDARTQLGFICYDAHVHYYLMSDGLTRPKEMTVLDIDDIFLPSPESLLVNLGEYREMIKELLTVLPQRYSTPGVPVSALGAALQAAYKLIAPTGGRITVFQTCLPNIGPGALQSREDPNARSSKEVAHLNPATDFYKRLALDCSGAQVSVDLFLLSSQYCDLATLSGMSKFSAGTVYHIPLFRAARAWQAEQLTRMFTRYLTRKIGFEAVMRVRCTRGITIHTFHGNLFVRSTDLLSLPNVSPDAGFGLQLVIDESLADLQQVCFQAALLYTSSKGERRIRVHTLALPIASNLTDVLHSADQQCIVGLLSKMAVDRAVSASLGEAREALTTVAVDALSAHRLAQNLPAGAAAAALHAPASLRLLPLLLLALLKRKAFRTGTSTRLDERVADMCAMKCLPLPQLMRLVYPDLYPIHALRDSAHSTRNDDELVPDPPRMQLTAERLSINGAYLLDDGETMIVYVCHGVSPAFLSECFGVAAFSQLADEARSLPRVDSPGNALLHAFVDKLNDDRPYAASMLVLRDNSPSRHVFTERLVDDRVESAFSYYEFLQHVKTQVK
ncbi:protein transport protein Sec24A [Epargyreus clarus]|uniref:protein transport protein Sec24A n=1 Tax=Epargyreus clarus TaxID=520877 RepID=UPI003C2C945B